MLKFRARSDTAVPLPALQFRRRRPERKGSSGFYMQGLFSGPPSGWGLSTEGSDIPRFLRLEPRECFAVNPASD